MVDEKSKEKTPYIATLLKSKFDGMPRDDTPIDMNVVLDISGSMVNIYSFYRINKNYKIFFLN